MNKLFYYPSTLLVVALHAQNCSAMYNPQRLLKYEAPKITQTAPTPTRQAANLLQRSAQEAEKKQTAEAEQCSLCLEKLKSPTHIIATLPCSPQHQHSYHFACLGKWHTASALNGIAPTCPLCKVKVAESISEEQDSKEMHAAIKILQDTKAELENCTPRLPEYIPALIAELEEKKANCCNKLLTQTHFPRQVALAAACVALGYFLQHAVSRN